MCWSTVIRVPVNSMTTLLFPPRGPQMFPCLTYLERNVRVDCEFPATDSSPGPYCEYRQDSRLVGSTYPITVTYVTIDDRRRSNVSLVAPNLCRLTWAPLADERPYTYTCRVYQGEDFKENSMAVHHSEDFILSLRHKQEPSKHTFCLVCRAPSHLLRNQRNGQISTVADIVADVTSCGRGSPLSLKTHLNHCDSASAWWNFLTRTSDCLWCLDVLSG